MRNLILIFIGALLILLAVIATQPRAIVTGAPVGPEHYCRNEACQIGALSGEEITRIGAAARLAADGNVAAQAWLDAQLAKVSQ